jgi:hypothetical protein
MARAYEPEALAQRIFYLSTAGIAVFIAVVFIFIL